jgi:hypothetical protein
MRLRLLALLADDHGLVPIALDHDGGGDAHQAVDRLGAALP